MIGTRGSIIAVLRPIARDARGMSAVELVIGLSIMAVALAIVLPRLSPQSYYFETDAREVADNLEVAREWARSRTGHYRLRVTSASAYVIERGVYGGGSWTFPTTERSLKLHARVAFDTGSVGQAAEFDSRGRLVGATLTLSLLDNERGLTKQFLVRPTGMVEIP